MSRTHSSLITTLLLILAMFSQFAGATLLTVENASDTGDPLSLREIIGSAAANDIIGFNSTFSGITLIKGPIAISKNLTINGPGATQLTISGSSQAIFSIGSGVTVTLNGLTFDGGFNTYSGVIKNAGNLTIKDCTLSNNGSGVAGGAIANDGPLTISKSTFSNNTAPYGGCIYNGKITAAPVKITDSILSNNLAHTDGGCIYNKAGWLTITNSTLSGNQADKNGAGIYNVAGGVTDIRNSVLFDNTAWAGGGGGIYNLGTLVIGNSTLSGNAATNGGGLYSGSLSQAKVYQSTITDNDAMTNGGGIWLTSTQPIVIGNSLVSGNRAKMPLLGNEIYIESAMPSSYFTSQGHNLFGENGVSGVLGGNPAASDIILSGMASTTAIFPLDNNGGLTKTHMLMPGSQAINAGANALALSYITDQRVVFNLGPPLINYPRIVDFVVDIGAVEKEYDRYPQYRLTLQTKGTGTGRVGDSGTFSSGTPLLLWFLADLGSHFDGWSPAPPCPTGDSANANFTMPAYNVTCTATFSIIFTVTVDYIGAGSGTVTISDSGEFAAGEMVNLTATADPGSTFTGWSPLPCAASFKVSSMQANPLNCKAIFTDTPTAYTLTLGKKGTGGGTVSSGGSNPYTAKTMVELTATPDGNSTFVGWDPSSSCPIGNASPNTFAMPAYNLTCTAIFNITPATYELILPVVDGGKVGIFDLGVTRGDYAVGTKIILKQEANLGYTFAGWSGPPCAGSFAMPPGNFTCTATFVAPSQTYLLTVTPAGTGSGTVTSSRNYAAGASVNLTAVPNTGSTFAGWSPSPCAATFTMPAYAFTCTATFTTVPPKTYVLTLIKTGNGTVSGAKNYAAGDVGTLTAIPDAGSTFAGWNPSSPCPIGNASQNTFTMPASDLACTATFTTIPPQTYALTLKKSGAGTGTVSGGGNYVARASVKLTAVASAGSTFAGWSASPCAATFTMPASALTCTATFTAAPSQTYALTLTKSEPSSGTLTGPDINCGTNCTKIYNSGTVVNLTATPVPGSAFIGWSGGCTGSNSTCTVTMSAAKTVKAAFSRPLLTVKKAGSGSGLITGLGISCGAYCNQSYNLNTPPITLTAKAATGSNFIAWIGCDSNPIPSQCTVTTKAAKAVIAIFNTTTANTYALTVYKTGNGLGTVASTPASLSCGANCVVNRPIGTSLILKATPAVGSMFTGWSGGVCAGIAPCTVNMNAAKVIIANFARPVLTVVKSGGSAAAKVYSIPAGIDCGSDCNEPYSYGSEVILVAVPGSSSFVGWRGCTTVSAAFCMVTLNQYKTFPVTAIFK
ncbi:MAG: hypothetical protein LAE24_01395 [Candidatus Contendobacter sp.]|nr:hypothetical protein [Candidatus Contendobacter sp.]